MRRQRSQVIRVMIHVMPIRGLRGAPMAAAIVRDHAIAMVEKEHQLSVPVI